MSPLGNAGDARRVAFLARLGGGATCAVLGTILLSSCGTQLSLPFSRNSATPKPMHYRDVATSKPMATTVPELYETGPTIRKKMLGLIDSAQDYLLIDSFLVVTDPVTLEIMEALKRKHEAGVRVYVLADSSSRYMEIGEAGFTWLSKAGIPNAEYNPMRLYKMLMAPVMLPRDHRKFWIVDGRELFLGGANIFNTSLIAPEEGGNRDYMVAVKSRDAIAHMIDSFVATWNQCGSGKLDKESFQVDGQHLSETQLWLSDQNKHAGHPDVVAKMFEGLFEVATREIWLIQPYTFVTPEFLQQFRDLVKRGVTVNVMLASDVHAPRFHYASYYGIKDILEAGGKVWIYKPGHGHLHAKAVVIDDRWASIGSANLNTRSIRFAKEANLIFGDPVSMERVMRSLEGLKKNCRPIDMDEAEEYRTGEYYAVWLWMQWVG